MAETENKKPLFKLRPDRKTTTAERMKKAEEWALLPMSEKRKITKAKYNKLTSAQKDQLKKFKTAGEAALWVGSLTPLGRGLKVGSAGIRALKNIKSASKKAPAIVKKTAKKIAEKPKKTASTIKKKLNKVLAPKDAKKVGKTQKLIRETVGLTEKGRRGGSAIRDQKGKLSGISPKTIQTAKNIRRTVPLIAATAVTTNLLRDKDKAPSAATKKSTNVLSKKRNKDNRLPPGAFGGKTKKSESVKGGRGNIVEKAGERAKAMANENTPSVVSSYGPIETKARNKFIKKSGGKDAFKSDKQIDSLFVNEMLDMREGSEGNSGFGLDDQNTYEAILEERKSRKKAGGKVSKKVGGKVVKRSMGGSAKPRKKTVFRRGGGKALRGFGKATYSNKMY